LAAERSIPYTLGFATLVCAICSVLVSGTAVALRERQEANRQREQLRNVLVAAGLAGAGEALTPEELVRRLERVEPRVVDRRSGEPLDHVDGATYDPWAAAEDPRTGTRAPDNRAMVGRVPDGLLVYEVWTGDGALDALVLPVHGMGLWSTLYGFLALEPDGETVRGIVFYQHAETPGLGGEVDDPAWRERWVGRRALDPAGDPRIQVIKGRAGDPADDPHRVDGLTGATLTGNGVSELLAFWLGGDGYGPFLERARSQGVPP